MKPIFYPQVPHNAKKWIAVAYDYISALVAERCGMQGILLGLDAVKESLYGTRAAEVSFDTLLQLVSNLHTATALEIYVELPVTCDDCPDSVRYRAERLKIAGAKGIAIAQMTSLEHWKKQLASVAECGLVAIAFVKKVDKAALQTLVLDEQIFVLAADFAGVKRNERCVLYCNDVDACTSIAAMADQCVLDFALTGTQEGLCLFAAHTMKDRNTVFHDQHDFDGDLNGHDYHEIFDFGNRWIAMEDSFIDTERRLKS